MKGGRGGKGSKNKLRGGEELGDRRKGCIVEYKMRRKEKKRKEIKEK
jgi:hypothetical protein